MNIKHILIGVSLGFVVLYSGVTPGEDLEISLRNDTNQTFQVWTPRILEYDGSMLVEGRMVELPPHETIEGSVPKKNHPYGLSIQSDLGWYEWNNISGVNDKSEFKLVNAAENGVKLIHKPAQGKEINLGVVDPK